MKTTLEKYNKLCDMELIQKSRYDINARIELIIADIQKQIQGYEDEARKTLGVEKSSTFSENNPTFQSQNGK